MEKRDFENTYFPPFNLFSFCKERLSASCSYHGNVSSVGAPWNVHPAATDHEFVMWIMEGGGRNLLEALFSTVLFLRAAMNTGGQDSAERYVCSGC
jgi:hypothetical protein